MCLIQINDDDDDELKQRLIDIWHRFKQSIIDDSVDEWRKCPCA